MFNSSPMLSKLNNDSISNLKQFNVKPQSINISSSLSSFTIATTSNTTTTNINNLTYLNLNDPSYELNSLKHFDFQSDNILKYIQNKFNSATIYVLFIDTSLKDPFSINPLKLHSNDSLTINKLHLNLPTTLIKRSKFKFENLLNVSLSNDKVENLLNLIDLSSVFFIFDKDSQFTRCTKRNYYLITKFNQFILSKYGTNKEIIFISSTNKFAPSSSSSSLYPNYKNSNQNQNQNIQKYNLSINIPQINLSTKKLFIQSIKKDTVHYSPVSLFKYFQFNIPSNIVKNDPCLPNWLKLFSDKQKSNQILLKLENNFQLLEDFEIERLSTCLVDNSNPNEHNISTNITTTTINNNNINNNDNNNDNNNNTLNANEDKKIVTPPLLINTNNSSINVGTNGPSTDTDFGDAETTSSTESLLTPLKNYELSKGVQSFNKNRYSNILPYEHSRVKLHYSPIEFPSQTDNNSNNNDNASNGFFIADDSSPIKISGDSFSVNSSTPSDIHNNNARRKRKGSSVISAGNLDDLKDSLEKNIFHARPMLLHSKSSPYIRNISSSDREKFNDYFNANYLQIPQINKDYKYVATQAPLVTTFDDFWNVVLSNDIRVIVSLNSESELEMKKWDVYWNNKTNLKYSINAIITLNNVNGLDGCILRIFQVFKKGKYNYSIVFHIQYTQWLDSCSIDIVELLKIFNLKDALISNPIECLKKIINKNQNAMNTGSDILNMKINHTIDLLPDSLNYKNLVRSNTPLLIHCSAGCGRTGVFIVLDFLIKILDKSTNQSNKIDVWNIPNDLIFIIVNELRKQRLSMVQNLSQYITCYESLLKYFALIKNKTIQSD
ncbi:uncharacterized protein PWA37_001063 [Arxiozyma heterogenica]|uniref:uncharacterized protein n=1 Tax=Arxiozyma heterogenica TaxID=278026 RepID=UPI002F1D543E